MGNRTFLKHLREVSNEEERVTEVVWHAAGVTRRKAAVDPQA